MSYETIYLSLFVQARGVLKKELVSHLRSRRTMRRGKQASTGDQRRGQIVDAVLSESGEPRPTTGPFPGTGR